MARLPDYSGPTIWFTVSQTLTALSFMAPPVFAVVALPELGLESSWIGIYPSFVFTAAMVSAALGGGLVARYGAVRVSQCGLLLCALGLAMIATAILPLGVLGAIVIGLGYGPGTPASSHVLSRITPPRNQPLVFSIKQTGVPAGGALAGLVVPPLVLGLGWRSAALAVACIALCLALLLQLIRRELDADRDRSAGAGLEILPALRLIARERALRMLALACLPLMAAQFCLGTYFVPFFVEEIGFGLIAAGQVLFFAQTAGIAGRVFWGAVAGRLLPSRHTLALLGLLVAAAAFAMALSDADWPFAALVLVGVLFGATAVGWNGVFIAEVARVAPRGEVSRATGATAVVAFAGAVGGPPLFGAVIAVLGGYAAGFAVLGAVAGLSGLGFLRTPAPAAERAS